MLYGCGRGWLVSGCCGGDGGGFGEVRECIVEEAEDKRGGGFIYIQYLDRRE